MKINRGTIRSMDGKRVAKIIVTPNMPKSRQQKIGICIGMICVGIYGMCKEYFKATVEGYEQAEFKAYDEIGALHKEEPKENRNEE